MRDAPRLTLVEAATHVETCVFGTAGSPLGDDRARHAVGVELEWLTVVDPGDRRLPPTAFEALRRELGTLPGGGALTLEPGGQLELSSAPADAVGDALSATALDVFTVDRAAAARGIDLVALGMDPVREPERVVHADRYAAMQAHFDRAGDAGRTMMTNTASVQLNVGLGPDDGVAARWRLANAIGPTLLAAFANSPLAGGRPTGWASSRQVTWATLDRSRAAPPPVDGHPATDWLQYALDAQVLCRHDDTGHLVPMIPATTFGRWLADGGDDGPTLDDFAYHLTTLFPPVRPRGWFELRMLDALPTPFWQVATIVAHTALTDDALAEPVRRAVAGTEALWAEAARFGLGHPALGEAADDLFTLVLEALAPTTTVDPFVDLAGAYAERWVRRRRTPADDHLDAWRRTGAVLPARRSPWLDRSIPWAEVRR